MTVADKMVKRMLDSLLSILRLRIYDQQAQDHSCFPLFANLLVFSSQGHRAV